MKINDGYWMTKRHYTVKSAGSAYEARRVGDALEILAVPGKIYGRGQTLGGANFTVTLSSPMPDVIGVRVVWHGGIPAKTPDFVLNADESFKPVITITDKEASLRSGNSEVRITLREGWDMRFYTGGRLVTSSCGRGLALIDEDETMTGVNAVLDENDYPWTMPRGAAHRMRERLSLSVGEKVYGFGERFGPLVKNGQTIDCWNADGGTSSEQAYKNVPFYLTNEGYGIFVDNPGAVSFEVASEVVSAVSFTVPENALEYYFIGCGSAEPDPKKVLSSYTALTGRPALPPAYTFGLWLTTSFTTNYDEKTVTSFIDGMTQRDIPLSVFHFDCFWMREFRWCDFEWDPRTFPDPAGMIARLKERGLHLCVWVNPYIGERSALFTEGAERGYFLRTRDGGIYQSDEWQPGMAVVDFTNPDAAEWYASKIRTLIDSGIDCIKTDFGERIPVNVVYHDGSDPVRMHNYYSLLYNETVYRELRGAGCLFARSATAGSQMYPVHWGGDCSATYQSMAETLRGGLSLCASGFAYFSHDISGFESTATPDIYKRWCAFGLLSTHSRLHGSSSYRVPWLFDEEAVSVLRSFTKLKGSLMPYLYTQAHVAATTGVPVMRAPALDFPRDIPALDADGEYMLGESLLVAPIFNERGVARFYVPDCGTWYDYLTGEAYEGGRYYEKKYDYYSLPLLVRPGTMVCSGDFTGNFDYDWTDRLTVAVGYLPDGGFACSNIISSDGKKTLRIAAKRIGGDLMLACDDDDIILIGRSLQELNVIS